MKKIIVILLPIILLTACTKVNIQSSTTTPETTSAFITITTPEIDNSYIETFHLSDVYIVDENLKLVNIGEFGLLDYDESKIQNYIYVPVFKRLSGENNNIIKQYIFNYVESFGFDLESIKKSDYFVFEVKDIIHEKESIKLKFSCKYKPENSTETCYNEKNVVVSINTNAITIN